MNQYTCLVSALITSTDDADWQHSTVRFHGRGFPPAGSNTTLCIPQRQTERKFELLILSVAA
jgi:hypothetical protein